MHRNHSVKILATVGPASSGPRRVVLHEAGADGFRLNLSHGAHQQYAER